MKLNNLIKKLDFLNFSQNIFIIYALNNYITLKKSNSFQAKTYENVHFLLTLHAYTFRDIHITCFFLEN